jgi:tRNA pseudouridine38-40 synthase|tara:strand:- start:7540 stop:8271 length:732 start_codon:yes stop_codon:yes gene_type:complete
LPNYKIVIEYDGTDFSGWQMQRTKRTVQGDIEGVLKKLTAGERVVLNGAGRTDAGVHARGQVANFRLEKVWNSQELKNALNGNLSDDLRILDCTAVPDSFHARFSAARRLYRYYCRLGESALDRRICWCVPKSVVVHKLRQCARLLNGEIDFTSFTKFSSQRDNRCCTVYQSGWNKRGDFVIFTMEANRFLRHLIRYLVGTMVEVAKGGLTVDDFGKTLEVKDPQAKVWKAPAAGLFLDRVSY